MSLTEEHFIEPLTTALGKCLDRCSRMTPSDLAELVAANEISSSWCFQRGGIEQAGYYQALGDLRRACVDKALAQLTQSGHAELARQALNRLTEAEVAQGGKASRLADRLDDYSAAVGQTKTAAQIAADSHNWKAHGLITGSEFDALKAQLQDLLAQANSLSGKSVDFSVHGDTHEALTRIEAIKRALAGIHDKTVRVQTLNEFRHADSVVRKVFKADGGWVGGYGGPRHDNQILAASTGEFVVNAASARANGALLEAINSGARIDVTRARPSTVGSASPAAGHTFNTTVNYAEPEKASESVPRVLRDAMYVSGAGW